MIRKITPVVFRDFLNYSEAEKTDKNETKNVKILFEGVCVGNSRHLGPGTRGRGPETADCEGGVGRSSRGSDATFSRVLCAPPFAARVWLAFSQNWAPHSGGAHSFLFFQHLPNGSSIFSYNRSEPQKCRELQSFLIASKNERFSLEVLQKSSR